MKRLLRAPVRIFIFAVQYRMYGMIAAYAIAFGFIATWIRNDFQSAAISVGVIVLCILIFRGVKGWLGRLTRGANDLHRKIRREERKKQLLEYLMKD